MDKILITNFKRKYANAILNSQEKLNPDKDAYIDENELQGVLDFFGEKDITKLLKSKKKDNKPSIFEKDNNSEQNTTEEAVISDFNTDETDALNIQGSAAQELENKTLADLSINSVGTPFAEQMETIQNLKIEYDKKNKSTIDIDTKIDVLKDLQEDYLNDNPDMEQQHLIIKEISYGQNDSKKAILSQSFGINGNNAMKKHDNNDDDIDDNDVDTEDETTDSDGNKDTDNSKGNIANADISYKIEFKTLNLPEEGNYRLKGIINAGSDNIDIHAAVQYTKKLNNDGHLNLFGNLRETIENKNNISSYGIALDYAKNKFSTGAYGMYYSQELDGSKEETYFGELYGKYSKSVKAAIGIEKDSESKYYYTKLSLNGKREIPSSNLSLTGSIKGEYGIVKLPENEYNLSMKKAEIQASGGLSFKSKDFSADLSANVKLSKDFYTVGNAKSSDKISTFYCIGNLSTKNIDISATVSSMNIPEISTYNTDTGEYGNRSTITTSIVLGIKNIFGKNIKPILKYNVGNYDGAKHNIGAGVIVTP